MLSYVYKSYVAHLGPSVGRLCSRYRNVSASSQLCPRHRWRILLSLRSCSRNRTCVRHRHSVPPVVVGPNEKIWHWTYLSASLPLAQTGNGTWRRGQRLWGWRVTGQHHVSAGAGHFPSIPLVTVQLEGVAQIPGVSCAFNTDPNVTTDKTDTTGPLVISVT